MSTNLLQIHDLFDLKFLEPNILLFHKMKRFVVLMIEETLKAQSRQDIYNQSHQSRHFQVLNPCVQFHYCANSQELSPLTQRKILQFSLEIVYYETNDHKDSHLLHILKRSKFCTHFRIHSPCLKQMDDLIKIEFLSHF